MVSKATREPLRVPKQARSRERVERVLEAARTLIAEKGCAGLKIGELARAANVTAGSIYQYFDNKAGIIAALAERYLESNRRTIEEAFSESPTTTDELAATTTGLIETYYQLHRNDPVVRDIWAGSASDKALADIEARDAELSVELIFDRSSHLFAVEHHDAVRRALLLIVNFVATAVGTAVSFEDTEGRLVMDEATTMLAASWQASLEPLAVDTDPL